jgi:PPOX class probable F420-dependent enzyme
VSAAGDELGLGRHALELWALELLRGARVGRLGTAAGGVPLVVPVCYALLEDGETLRVVSAVDAKPKTSRRLRRVRNLEQNPRATLLVDVWDEDWEKLRWVMVEGEARVLDSADAAVQGARDEALRALEQKYPQYHKLPLEPLETPVIVLVATRILAWRSGDLPAASR